MEDFYDDYDDEGSLYIQKFDIKHLEEIRNEFFKYINVINAQETDKEHLNPNGILQDYME